MLKLRELAEILFVPCFVLSVPVFCLAFLSGIDFPVFAETDAKRLSSKEESDLPLQLKSNSLSHVSLLSGRAVLEFDPFGDASALKVFVEYKNSCSQALKAVQFRIRTLDKRGREVSSFRGVDSSLLEPGATGKQQWKYAGRLRKVERLQLEVVKVKYADGKVWDADEFKKTDFHDANWD